MTIPILWFSPPKKGEVIRSRKLGLAPPEGAVANDQRPELAVIFKGPLDDDYFTAMCDLFPVAQALSDAESMAAAMEGDTDSDEDEVESEGNLSDDIPVPITPHEEQRVGRYYLDNSSDSDELNTHRVVRPLKVKLKEEMWSTVEQIRNATKINDWVSLQGCFENLNKQLEKEDANDDGKDDGDNEYDSGPDNNHGGSQNEEPWKLIDNKDNPIDKEFPKDQSEITWEIVDKKLKEIVASRGKKAQFDINPSLLGHMPISVWQSCANNILLVLDILQQYPNIVIDNSVDPAEKETCAGADYDGTIHVSGDLAALLERLDSQYFKSLQCTDPHTKDYVERLRDEPLFMVVAQNIQSYLERVGNFRASAKERLEKRPDTLPYAYQPRTSGSSLFHFCHVDRGSLHGVCIVSMMMIQEELQARWDQPTRSIIFQNAEQTRLQRLLSQIADNLSVIVERNEMAYSGKSLVEEAPRHRAENQDPSKMGSWQGNLVSSQAKHSGRRPGYTGGATGFAQAGQMHQKNRNDKALHGNYGRVHIQAYPSATRMVNLKRAIGV
nr:unnamed protein product [Digitaria exilis]